MPKPYRISLALPPELEGPLARIRQETGLGVQDTVIEALLCYLEEFGARPADFPSLEERQAQRSERMRRVARVRWGKQRGQSPS